MNIDIGWIVVLLHSKPSHICCPLQSRVCTAQKQATDTPKYFSTKKQTNAPEAFRC